MPKIAYIDGTIISMNYIYHWILAYLKYLYVLVLIVQALLYMHIYS